MTHIKTTQPHHPQISMIAAMAENHTIGLNGRLPWHIPADLKHFKQLTLNKPIIMGRKTFDSIGKPLPNRQNIIISRNPFFTEAGCHVFNSLHDALHHFKNYEEIMIIGGAKIYAEALPLATRLYLTLVHAQIEGDVFFPKFNREEWEETERENFSPDAKNPYAFSFITLNRKNK